MTARLALIAAVSLTRGRCVSELVVDSGYAPGALARLVEMHALYYARDWGFGAYFEAKVAAEAAAFLQALPDPDSNFWFARDNGRVVGSIAIDGRADRGSAVPAHLRWFITDDGVRGTGAGARLLDAALDFCRERRFPSVYLWTFAGLDSARKLYEARRFRLVEEIEAASWGVRVREQRFVLELGAA